MGGSQTNVHCPKARLDLTVRDLAAQEGGSPNRLWTQARRKRREPPQSEDFVSTR